MPALAALSVLVLNCHSAPPPKAPVAESHPAVAPEPEPEPVPVPVPETATAPATRTAPAPTVPVHDPQRCAMPTRAYPAWCNTIPKDRVKPVTKRTAP